MSEENLCVLIDFENIAAGTERENLGKFNVQLVLNRLKEKGRILISRAYGDWGRFANFKQRLLQQGVSMMELTSFRGQDKNRADIALVVDAMELAFTREHITTYVLLSGDSDFTPLVMKLREFNKKVIGIGTRGSTSKLLANSCDEFIFYDSLIKDAFVQDNEKLSIKDAFRLLQQSLRGLQKDNIGPVTPSRLKQAMRRKLPTFDEGEFGFTGFSRFLRAAADSKRISLMSKGDNILVDAYSSSDADKVDLLERDLSFLSDEAKRLYNILVQEGHHPTTHVIRHTVVHEFVDHCQDRQAKRKKNTLFYSYGDIERRCRKTTPFVEGTFVRSILDDLHGAQVLRHPNGGALRSQKVGFVIKQDAEEMLQALREYYLQLLLQKHADAITPTLLSELFWNDDRHIEESEQLLAIQERQESIEEPLKEGIKKQAKKDATSAFSISEDDIDEGLEDLGLAWEEETTPATQKETEKETTTEKKTKVSSKKPRRTTKPQKDEPTKKSAKKLENSSKEDDSTSSTSKVSQKEENSGEENQTELAAETSTNTDEAESKPEEMKIKQEAETKPETKAKPKSTRGRRKKTEDEDAATTSTKTTRKKATTAKSTTKKAATKKKAPVKKASTKKMTTKKTTAKKATTKKKTTDTADQVNNKNIEDATDS